MSKELELKKGRSSFRLVGRVLDKNNMFTMEQSNEASTWVSNRLNLGLDCGEKAGTIYASMYGGHSTDISKESEIYVHGKKDDGYDDWQNRFTVKFNDRFNEEILKTIGENSFIPVALEVDTNNKAVTKKFLSQYDAIEYIEQHLKADQIVLVDGSVEWDIYQDVVKPKLIITSIRLLTGDKYTLGATFKQTILMKKGSIVDIDKKMGIVSIEGKVVEYLRDGKTHEKNPLIKGNVPLDYNFEYKFDKDNANYPKLLKYLFEVKKGTYTAFDFDGEISMGGATVETTVDDLPEDLKMLVDLGGMSVEDALRKCTVNSPRETKFTIVTPTFKSIEKDDGSKTQERVLEAEKYDEDDLEIANFYKDEEDFTAQLLAEEEKKKSAKTKKSETVEETIEKVMESEIEAIGDGDDWLNSLL